MDLLPGIIWSCFLGLAIGNFATNPIYRLPRNESLFLKDPYCGDCNALLKPRDLFPVFSWLMTRGRCRYCGASVPGAYTFTEALIAVLFVIGYLHMGFTEQYILVVFGLTGFVMLAMMLLLDNFFSDKTLIACLVLGALHRALIDGTLYGFAGPAFAGLLIGGLIWKLSGKPFIRDLAGFPSYLKLLVAAGVWVPMPSLLAVYIAMLVAMVVKGKNQWLPEWTIIVCVTLLTLYPHITLSR